MVDDCLRSNIEILNRQILVNISLQLLNSIFSILSINLCSLHFQRNRISKKKKSKQSFEIIRIIYFTLGNSIKILRLGKSVFLFSIYFKAICVLETMGHKILVSSTVRTVCRVIFRVIGEDSFVYALMIQATTNTLAPFHLPSCG